MVHRLDEDTSGVLLFSKNPKSKEALQKNWQDIVSSRRYYAIVEGKIEKESATLINYLKENSLNLVYCSDDRVNGKKAVTHYKVIKSNSNYSLLDINIESGRKNQIRVQLGNIGHYVIGDDKYGEPSDPLKRLGLHAYELSFVHPLTNKKYRFVAPIPDEFNKLMNER